MTLENDDKTYTASEVLDICETENIPCMFDFHHYKANRHSSENLEIILPRVFKTWKHTPHPPKIHVSSPKSEAACRSHADYVDLTFILLLINAIKQYGQSLDIMVEAKQKDKAALQLVKELADLRGIKRLDGAVLKI
ncbi:UV DNA damage endonuclease [Alteribacillus bidgolensis]|uniref:UV DNA damage endonuclease n=1 Tax=Alteribacillus bidgolensis TaxID=930129 RepID=A0A1G8CIC8_9BACI|nr:UV DNA damage endonuclease [Alteribacillus bidgolensis]